MNRRKAIGALIGGATAGPQAAKAAFESMKHFAPPPGYPSTSGMEVNKLDTTAERLAQARRVLAGDFSHIPKGYPERGGNPYDCLKSISENGRSAMYNNLYERQWKARMIENAREALAEYDKTGILRYFY